MPSRQTAPKSGVLILGAGHAGFQTAKSLRDRGYEGPLTLVDSNQCEPFQRPPLSKSFLRGDSGEEELRFAEPSYFIEQDISLLTGTTATAIDRANQTVRFAEDSVLEYEHLVLATGARARVLAIPGAATTGVHVLRSLQDAAQLRRAVSPDLNVVVVGAGFIGLEFVAALLEVGISPVVLEFSGRVLGRAVSKHVSAFFGEHYLAQGAKLQFGRGAAEFHSSGGRVTGVTDSAGEYYRADLVVVGVGVEPESGLAEAAGLSVSNGVDVDEMLTTSDPSVSAVGDCCNYPSITGPERVRLESVQNAMGHGRAVASKLAGEPVPYSEIPWFWSDQGRKKLQIAGLNSGYDSEVLRGDTSTGQFSVFMYRDGGLVAVDSVDRPTDHIAARRLITAQKQLSPIEAADTRFDIKSYAMSQ